MHAAARSGIAAPGPPSTPASSSAYNESREAVAVPCLEDSESRTRARPAPRAERATLPVSTRRLQPRPCSSSPVRVCPFPLLRSPLARSGGEETHGLGAVSPLCWATAPRRTRKQAGLTPSPSCGPFSPCSFRLSPPPLWGEDYWSDHVEWDWDKAAAAAFQWHLLVPAIEPPPAFTPAAATLHPPGLQRPPPPPPHPTSGSDASSDILARNPIFVAAPLSWGVRCAKY